jgi:hypothetical protein
VLLRRNKGEWREPEVTEYPDESELQRMIAESPTLLPGVDGPVPLVREFPCHFGMIDIVAVDLSGRITICECKTARNQELRRKVVGQIFAYAAALSGLSWEEFANRFERASKSALVDRAQEIAKDDAVDEWDEETFRSETARCLEAGDFRMVLAVEAIPEELRETVRFLNLHSVSGLEVLVLELSYRRDGDLEILVPHTWGEESTKGSTSRTRRQIDRDGLLERIGKHTSAGDAADAVLDWAEKHPDLEIRYTTANAAIETISPRLTFLWVTFQGHVSVELDTLREQGDSWSDESSERLVKDLEEIDIHLEPRRGGVRASLAPLADEGRRQRFFELMERPRTALGG